MVQMKQRQYLPRFLQNTCRWAEVSSTRSPLITISFLLNSFSSINLTISPFVCALGGGHWHADVVHPWFGRAEEHSGPSRAHPCCGGCDRPGHLHVNVWELRRSNKSGSWPGTAPLHADRRLGHRGLHVSSCCNSKHSFHRHSTLVSLEMLGGGVLTVLTCFLQWVSERICKDIENCWYHWATKKFNYNRIGKWLWGCV